MIVLLGFSPAVLSAVQYRLGWYYCTCFVDETHWFSMNLSKKIDHQDKVLPKHPVRTHQQARFVVEHFYAESTDSPAELRSQTNNNNYATAQT